jgi:endoplasmic reticulum junction formation protein lunapark
MSCPVRPMILSVESGRRSAHFLRIYTIRIILGKFFDYRISQAQRLLDSLNKHRQETIEKLKVATKYNSTQQLLEKYGGDFKPASPKNGGNPKRKESGSKAKNPQMGGRTGLPPPPTANIRRPQDGPISPNSIHPPSGSGPYLPPAAYTRSNFPTPVPIDEPGFAPNAFPTPPQWPHYVEQPHWYDRLLDVLLGEDETLAKNRLALICETCRLVNGQAPPGLKSLEELGRWRCGACGAWNGLKNETKLLADIQSQSQSGEEVQESGSGGIEEVSFSGDATDNDNVVEVIHDDRISSGDSEEREEVRQADIEQEELPTVKRRRGRPRSSKKE